MVVDFEDGMWKFTFLFLRIICVYRFTHQNSCHPCDTTNFNSTQLSIQTASTGVKAMCKYYGTVLGWTTNPYLHLLYVCPCIIYEIDERHPLDATIYLLL